LLRSTDGLQRRKRKGTNPRDARTCPAALQLAAEGAVLKDGKETIDPRRRTPQPLPLLMDRR
jgi:hypothetical protein